MAQLQSYRLSLRADKDLSEIYDYTLLEFGSNQAVKYVSDFEELFNKLVQNPEIGRARPEIKQGLRSVVKESHVVFYRIMNNHIRIVRVLHVKKDLRSFKD